MTSSAFRRASLASLAMVGAAASFSAFSEERLTVAWYGGNWGDAFKACVADPFTKATGVTVVPEVALGLWCAGGLLGFAFRGRK